MICNGCKIDKADTKKRRQNTNYVKDEQNWNILCEECQKEADEPHAR